MDWALVELPTGGAADADELAGRLWALGVAGVEERPGGTGPVLVAAVPIDRLDRLRAELGQRVAAVAPVAADAGLDAWRAHAEVVRVGAVVLRPPWLPHVAAPGELVVELDPGRAFGSGSHPTTRALVAAVAARARPGATALDVGSGSGVLAVVAALLGAEALAVDVDPAAVEATLANAAANGVAGRVRASAGPLAEVAGSFSLVLANLSAATVVELAPALTRRVAAGGELLASGVLAEQAAEVGAALGAEGLEVGEPEAVGGGWVVLPARPVGGGLRPPG